MPLVGVDRLMNRVSRLKRDVKDPARPLRAAGTYMMGSIARNFNAGGRPKPWQKLAASTVRRRRKGKGRGGMKILIDKGQLRNSPTRRFRRDSVEVGTNMVQAKRQHFGYPGHDGPGGSETPARPFMMFQDEDPDAIGQIFMRDISR